MCLKREFSDNSPTILGEYWAERYLVGEYAEGSQTILIEVFEEEAIIVF